MHEIVKTRSSGSELATRSGHRLRSILQLEGRSVKSVCAAPIDDFAIIPSVVFSHSKTIGASGACVYMIMCFYHDDGVAWLSVGVIADRLGISERQTRRLVRKLEDTGLIETRHVPGHGNVYIINDLFEDSDT